MKKYTVEPTDDITVIRFHEKPDADDIFRAIDEASLVDRAGRRLWVLGSGMDLSSDELRKIAEHARARLSARSKSAVVAPEDLSFGLARIHEAYRITEEHDNRVFRTEAEAIAWLREPHGD